MILEIVAKLADKFQIYLNLRRCEISKNFKNPGLIHFGKKFMFKSAVLS